MIRWIPCILLAACAAAAQAAPQPTPSNPTAAQDELERAVADRSLRGQLEQVRQTVATSTSDVVVNAMGFLGVPYRRGGTNAETGFDCSGFVRAVYDQTVGHLLPRRANEQAAAAQTVQRDELQPGDLVFFNTMRRAFSHVGIYVGDGKFIHAPRAGAEVRVEDMRQTYWTKRFNGARRVKELQAHQAAAL